MAEYSLNGRPTCLAVYSERPRTIEQAVTQPAKAIKEESVAKEKKKNENKQDNRRTTSESGAFSFRTCFLLIYI